jgi:type VI secretion system protein ImpJ
MLVARHLAGALPPMSVLLHGAAHPERLYECLAGTVGRVAQFAASPLPLKMAPYQHDDCLPQFQAAWRYIEDTLAVEFERVRQDRLRAPQPEYDIRPFQIQGPGGFSYKLPQQVEGHLIIEVKRKDGQTIEEAGRWLSQADIADASLIPQLQRQRVPGARVRPLGADEVARYQLPTLADLFLVENRTVDLADLGRRELFAPDQPLSIQGHAGPHMPAAIFLYQKMRSDVGTEAEAA